MSLTLVDGPTATLDLTRWTGPITRADESVLRRAVGPVLDIGCGPARHVRALALRGVLARGLDASPEAVRLAQRHGTHIIHRSIFDDLPGLGSWNTALLLDGSIGIGGAPVALLRRAGDVLAPGGTALVEALPPGTPTRVLRAAVCAGGRHSDAFPWAEVGVDDLPALAHAAGLRCIARWTAGGRWFAALSSGPLQRPASS